MVTTIKVSPAPVTGPVVGASEGADTEEELSLAAELGRWFANVLVWLLLSIAGLSFLGLGVGPHILPYRTMTMLTGSMVPTVRPGDVVVDTPEPARDLRIGQIVTYHIPVLDHHVESHRIVSLHRHDGAITFVTKGDANSGPDPWTAKVPENATMWRVRGVVPGLGAAIRLLRQPVVGFILRWGGLGAVVALVMASIWRRSDEAEDAEEPTPHQVS